MNMKTSPSPEQPAQVDLRELVESEMSHIVFQPIVKDGSRAENEEEIIDYEALVRFPKLPTEATIVELEKKENAHLLTKLTRQNLRKTVIFLSQTKKELGYPMPPIAINLSPEQITSWPDFPDELEELVTEYGLEGKDLIIEITERGFLDLEPEQLKNFCSRLGAFGVKVLQDDYDDSSAKISADDRRTPLDIIRSSGIAGLKMSANFLLNNFREAEKAIIYAKEKEDFRLIIEQVRNEATKIAVLKKLRVAGFPTEQIGLQGYALSKPLTPDQVVADLRRKHALASLNYITAEAA